MINYYTFRSSVNKSVEIKVNSYFQCLEVIFFGENGKRYNLHMLFKALTWIMKFLPKKFRRMSFGCYHCLAATNVRNQDQQHQQRKSLTENMNHFYFHSFKRKGDKKKYNMKKTTSIYLKQMAIYNGRRNGINAKMLESAMIISSKAISSHNWSKRR